MEDNIWTEIQLDRATLPDHMQQVFFHVVDNEIRTPYEDINKPKVVIKGYYDHDQIGFFDLRGNFYDANSEVIDWKPIKTIDHQKLYIFPSLTKG